MNQKYPTEIYRDAIEKYRAGFHAQTEDIRSFQTQMLQNFRTLMGVFLNDAFAILGPPPCTYDLRAMGSLAREEQAPYSDLEWFILIENEDHIPYFKKLAWVLELLVISLGETSSKEIPIFNSICKGLFIDVSPANETVCQLVGNPTTIASQITKSGKTPGEGSFDATTPQKSLLQSSSFATDNPSLSIDFQKELKANLNNRQNTDSNETVCQLVGNPTTIASQITKSGTTPGEGSFDATTPQKCLLQSSSFATDNPSLSIDFQKELKANLNNRQNTDSDDNCETEPLYLTRAEQVFKYLKGTHLPLSGWAADTTILDTIAIKWTTTPENLVEIDLKEKFIEPINHLIEVIALYFDIKETNTLEVIDALIDKKVFDRSTGTLLKETVTAIYWMRLRLQLAYKEKRDSAACSAAQSHIFFDEKEKNVLFRTYWLLLRPLYNTFDKIITQSEINLPVEALNELIKEPDVRSLKLFLPHLARHLAKHGDLEVHIQILVALQDLHSFRHLYLSVLEKEGVNITSLAKHPARNGIRYAEVQDIRYMADALQHITTDDPASGVVVQHSAIGRRYLHPDVAKQILDGSGNIMEVESSCRHRVASAECSPFHLFFKQKPNHPMMEYAIHSLSYKTVGKSTPPTELVRFEVNGKAYPVLISQAIEGSTLKMASAVDINRASLTRMLLMSILTRPGDGLDSNYIIDDQGNIFCIDNDISFVEPVEKTLMGLLMGLKINFSSILFCFDQELLDPATLEAFTMLSPEDILHCWMTELIIKEQEYLALFSKDECAELYKEDKQGNRFTPSLLLKEGTTPTLCHQFDHLQRELIENNYQMTAQDLLKTLVSLGSEVGESVALRYSGAFTRRNRTPQERLKSVTGATQSMTSGNGFKASLGSIPSTGDIEKRKWFSLEEAKDELFPLIEQVSGGKYIKFDEKHRVLHVPFEKTDRHETVLKVAAKKVGAYGVPTELSLRGCKKISLSTLGPFLSDELRFLDLRNCPNLKSDMMELIAKKCPSLEELYLSSTEIEVVAEQTRFGQTRPLRMPNLKTLHISRCKNLRMIKLESPCLVHFKAKDNPMLREADLEAVFPIIDGSPCKPRTVWRDINIYLLRKILPLFPSTVFVDNQYIYGILTDRLSESEIQKIFEPQNDCLTQLDLENNDIGAAGAQALAQVLPQTQITQLHLGSNDIGDAGAQALAQVLPQTQISQLNLSFNFIRNAGAQAIAQVLHKPRSHN